MKKRIILCSIVSVLCISTVFAQETESIKKGKMEISVGYVYGWYSGDYAKEYFKGYSGFEVDFSIATGAKWLALGGFIKNAKSDQASLESYGEGYDSAKMKMTSWGPSLHLIFSEYFKLYTRVGFAKYSEAASAWGITDMEKVTGTNIDFGAKVYIPMGKTFNLFGRAEYTAVKLKDAEFDGGLDSFSIGAGIALRF